MPSPRATAAIIPCFNEAATIATIVRETKRFVQAIYVVDDGSIDSTGLRAKEAGAIVLRHEMNLGKGVSLRDGFLAAQAAGHGWAVTLDGDGQHLPEEIPKLLAQLQNGADLVVGNRMDQPIAMSWLRRQVNRWMSKRIEAELGIPCPDSQCGFRALKLESWAHVSLVQNRFEVESEMLLAFARAGLKIAFIPVSCLPARRRSRIRPIADALRWIGWWMRARRDQ